MNHKTIVLGLAMLFLGSVFAQEKRTIKVIVPNKTDEVFITGNQESLGNWDPGSIKLNTISDFEREITLDLTYPAEFKFTKGNWDKEGIINNLDNNPNQILQDSNSKNIFNIKGWSNDTSAQSLGLDYGVINFQSKYLQGDRLIKIVLPENYDPAKKYPVFYTTDGGWNIFSVAKNYISNLSLDEYKLIPESILVGIVHGMTNNDYNRNKDLDVYYKESGKKFKDFVFKELVPYINTTYSTSGFNVMIGHSNGAEYNHFLLLEENSPFRGFISLSTNFYSKDVRAEMADFMRTYEGKNLYYFVANATHDSPDRIEAGEDYENIYNANTNDKFQFKMTTYKANHNSIVPLALSDGIQFIFKDYRNFDDYKDFTAYQDNYLNDLKYTYGLEANFSIDDLDSILSDIMQNKNKDDLEKYLKFVEDHKLWQSPYMKEPGGMDAVNKGNFYFFVEDFDKSANNYEMACELLGKETMPRVFFGNLGKGIDAFKKIEAYDRLMDLLVNSKIYLNTASQLSEKSTKYNLLFINYHIAKLSNEQNMNRKEGKKALTYCKDNYKKNSTFTAEELEALR